MKVKIITKGFHYELVTKETINLIVKECMDILKENKGLEVVHVEASDGTFVSIKL